MKQTVLFFVLGIALIGSGGCTSAPPQPPAPTRAELIASLSNAEIANEYRRRTRELLFRAPPKRPQDAETPEQFHAELLDESSDMNRYAKKFFEDHKTFAEADDPSSMSSVADAYWTGWYGIVEVDICKAIEISLDVALINTASGAPVLADAYHMGRGLEHDPKRAYFWAKEIYHRGGGVTDWGKKQLTYLAQATSEQKIQWDKEWSEWVPYYDIQQEKKKPCIKDN